MQKMPNREDPWAGEYFIDISSRGKQRNGPPPPNRKTDQRRKGKKDRRDVRPGRREEPRAPASENVRRTANRRDYEAQDTRPPRPRPSPDPRDRNARKERKPKAPMKKSTVRLLKLLLGAAAVFGTVLLCIFLLFNISSVEITGDIVYEDRIILDICDIEIGENLVFLPSSSIESALYKQLPYIEEVKIKKRLPGKVEINITGARIASCVEEGDNWLYISEKGKILERSAIPAEGMMLVKGITCEDSTPGTLFKAENTETYAVYEEIIETMIQLQIVSQFTRLDLSDIFNIRIYYQDRICLHLGNAVDLDYKVTSGYRIVSDEENIGAKEIGTLDLTSAGDIKRSTFTPQSREEFISLYGDTDSEEPPENEENVPPEAEGEEDSETARGENIPDSAFAGE